MRIDYLDAEGVRSLPTEADAPLLVDTDAVLSRAIALEHFQPVAGRNQQLFQPRRRVQQSQLFQRLLLIVFK